MHTREYQHNNTPNKIKPKENYLPFKDHLSSHLVYNEVCVTQSLGLFGVVLCILLFVLLFFILAFVLSVGIRFGASGYSFGIFKLHRWRNA